MYKFKRPKYKPQRGEPAPKRLKSNHTSSGEIIKHELPVELGLKRNTHCVHGVKIWKKFTGGREGPTRGFSKYSTS
jgi:hypothetical protein